MFVYFWVQVSRSKRRLRSQSQAYKFQKLRALLGGNYVFHWFMLVQLSNANFNFTPPSIQFHQVCNQLLCHSHKVGKVAALLEFLVTLSKSSRSSRSLLLHHSRRFRLLISSYFQDLYGLFGRQGTHRIHY